MQIDIYIAILLDFSEF